ncbi:MAG: cytosine permease [Actinomycetota bacterium]|nr:cytosine permease [Actinomycetota bacterium]MDA8396323.1 cytosine permease [Actinomycetota bacterium]
MVTSTAENVESHSIDIIPAEERFGRPRQLAPFWFAANQQFLTLVTGVLAVVLGLNLFWAIVAIVLGNLFGTVFMAYHSAQGPTLGVTQMIQSRGQFGFYGAFFLFVGAFFLQFGFYASATALSGDALNTLDRSITVPAGIIIIAIPTLVLAVLGYRWLHAWQRWASIGLLVVFAVVTVQTAAVATRIGLPAHSFSTAAPNWGTFLAVVSVSATYAITWAPFVSDYSRYLPAESSVRSCFGWTYLGTVVSCVWLEVLGSVTVVLYPKLSTAAALDKISGAWLLVILAISMIGAATTNLYSGMVALATAASTWWTPRRSAAVRVVGVGITFVAGLVIALTGYASFLNNFTNFLLVLAFIFIPWTAVNLADFYLVRRGRYDPRSFFTPKGIYGGWVWQALLAYFVGLLMQVPFIDQAFYVGPLVAALGGADISWIVGIVVPGVLYVLLARRWPPAGNEVAPSSLADAAPSGLFPQPATEIAP